MDFSRHNNLFNNFQYNNIYENKKENNKVLFGIPDLNSYYIKKVIIKFKIYYFIAKTQM